MRRSSERWAAVVLLVAGVALVGYLTAGPPKAELQGRVAVALHELLTRLPGGPPDRSTTSTAVDVASNVALLVPVGVAARLVSARLSGAAIVGLVALGSAGVELLQAFVLTTRSAQVIDWIANTVGGALGVALGARISRARSAGSLGSRPAAPR